MQLMYHILYINCLIWTLLGLSNCRKWIDGWMLAWVLSEWPESQLILKVAVWIYRTLILRDSKISRVEWEIFLAQLCMLSLSACTPSACWVWLIKAVKIQDTVSQRECLNTVFFISYICWAKEMLSINSLI